MSRTGVLWPKPGGNVHQDYYTRPCPSGPLLSCHTGKEGHSAGMGPLPTQLKPWGIPEAVLAQPAMHATGMRTPNLRWQLSTLDPIHGEVKLKESPPTTILHMIMQPRKKKSSSPLHLRWAVQDCRALMKHT
jgi:hypothetical protein